MSFIINLFVVAVFAAAFSSPEEASKASLKLAVSNGYTTVCPLLRGDNPRALATLSGVGSLRTYVSVLTCNHYFNVLTYF